VGQAMHLIPVDGQAQTSPLDSFVFRSLVFSILETMQRLFYDSDKLKNRYGCRPSSQLRLGSIETSSISRALAAAFADFKVDGSTEAVRSNYVQKTRWLIHDHKKFKALISDIKDFVDGLQNITKELSPKPFQESAIRRRIGLIEDVATLEVVAEVCETDQWSLGLGFDGLLQKACPAHHQMR
jgi:Prion-inhibition and propagation